MPRLQFDRGDDLADIAPWRDACLKVDHGGQDLTLGARGVLNTTRVT